MLKRGQSSELGEGRDDREKTGRLSRANVVAMVAAGACLLSGCAQAAGSGENNDRTLLSPEKVAAKLGPKIIEISKTPPDQLKGKILSKATAGPTPDDPDAPRQTYLLMRAPGGEEYILTVVSDSNGSPSAVSIKTAAPDTSKKDSFDTDTHGRVVGEERLAQNVIGNALTLLESIGLK